MLKDLLDIAIHSNGHTFAIGSTNNTVSIWDSKTGEKVNVYEGHTTPVNRIVYSSDGKFMVSASRDSKIHIWHADTMELNRIFNTNLERIFYLSYSPDTKYPHCHSISSSFCAVATCSKILSRRD